MGKAAHRAVLLLFVALTAPALAPVSEAQARVTWLVRGHGFGHGVGMSQYGAYGYAKHGKGYRFILAHYYAGTSVRTLSGPHPVRVLIDSLGGDVGFSGATSACGRRLNPKQRYEAHGAGGSVRLRNASGRSLAGCGRRLRADGNGRIGIAGARYRGALEVVPSGGGLNVINAVPVDQYVKGVIANESPSSWPQAALRAQAVAARSYALTGDVGGKGFNLYPDTRSQVYEGIASETTATNRAANATKGQVVMYRGKIAQTFFSACSGGHTESIQNVFFGPAVPYLVGVPDPYDYYCPLHSWTLRFSEPQISARLGPYLDGALKRVEVTQRGASPRIVWARLVGTGGVSKVRGDQLTSALGAYDRWMTFRKLVDGRVVGGEGGEGEEGGPPHKPPGGAEAG